MFAMGTALIYVNNFSEAQVHTVSQWYAEFVLCINLNLIETVKFNNSIELIQYQFHLKIFRKQNT